MKDKSEAKRERDAEKDLARELAYKERGATLVDIYTKDAGSVLAAARDETPFLVQDYIPQGGVVFFAGKPGAKKSWLAYDLCLAVVRNDKWLGQPVIGTKHTALVLNYDNPEWELGRRFKRLGMDAEDQIFFHSMSSRLPPEGLPAILQLPSTIEAIVAICDQLDPTIIVVDSLRQAHTGEEKSSSDMARVMSCLKLLTGRGATVIALHHLRKSAPGETETGGDAMRGSTEILASADCSVMVHEDRCEWQKTRGWILDDARKAIPFSVEDDKNEPTTYVRKSNPYGALITALAQKPLSRTEIYQALGLDKVKGKALLDRAEVLGIIEAAPRKKAADPFMWRLKEA